ncbi:hypothetical protein Droror1_Dr00019844, partial [Drosera rotundifolia]
DKVNGWTSLVVENSHGRELLPRVCSHGNSTVQPCCANPATDPAKTRTTIPLGQYSPTPYLVIFVVLSRVE